MKFLRMGLFFGATIAAGVIAIGCGGGGGGGGGGGTPPAGAVSINALDGKTDVSVSNAFTYQFAQSVTTSTVTASTFFMVPA
jgi:hypothetical protein